MKNKVFFSLFFTSRMREIIHTRKWPYYCSIVFGCLLIFFSHRHNNIHYHRKCYNIVICKSFKIFSWKIHPSVSFASLFLAMIFINVFFWGFYILKLFCFSFYHWFLLKSLTATFVHIYSKPSKIPSKKNKKIICFDPTVQIQLSLSKDFFLWFTFTYMHFPASIGWLDLFSFFFFTFSILAKKIIAWKIQLNIFFFWK